MPAQQANQNTNANAQNGSRSLADILLANGVLEQERAEQVKLAEIQTGKSQEDIINDQNLVENAELVRAKAELYNIPYVDLDTTPSSPEAMAILPQEVANRFKVFPVAVDRASKTMNLAMSDPLDLTAIEFIEQKTGIPVVSITYDGTGGSKNDIVIPYLTYPRNYRLAEDFQFGG